MQLLAVHIADSVLAPVWVTAGWLGLVLLILLGCWRVREEEVPRVALLTAAFFVASSIHVGLGPGSVHLLLNGLLGVVLGRRAALAIPLGVFMQAVLLQHGGYSTIGINSCIMALPALAAGPLFLGLQRLPGVRRPSIRAALVGLSTVPVVLSLVNGGALLYSKLASASGTLDPALANDLTFRPLTLVPAFLLALLAGLAEGYLDHAPEFPLGLLVGELAVLATVVLHCLVLILGGQENWELWALIDLIVHLPLAVLEGVIVGFTVGFLARVKPELLGGLPVPKETMTMTNGERRTGNRE